MFWAVVSEGLGLERFWHPGAEVLLVRGERSFWKRLGHTCLAILSQPA